MTRITKFKYNKQIFYPYNSNFMRLKVYRRHHKPIYKIVVTNKNRGVICTLGYYNPFKINFMLSNREALQTEFTTKVLVLDRHATMAWMRRGVIPSIVLCYLLEQMGLIKTHSEDSSYVSQKFR